MAKRQFHQNITKYTHRCASHSHDKKDVSPEHNKQGCASHSHDKKFHQNITKYTHRCASHSHDKKDVSP